LRGISSVWLKESTAEQHRRLNALACDFGKVTAMSAASAAAFLPERLPHILKFFKSQDRAETPATVGEEVTFHRDRCGGLV
jgi:hypothetical protein